MIPPTADPRLPTFPLPSSLGSLHFAWTKTSAWKFSWMVLISPSLINTTRVKTSFCVKMEKYNIHGKFNVMFMLNKSDDVDLIWRYMCSVSACTICTCIIINDHLYYVILVHTTSTCIMHIYIIVVLFDTD